MWWGKVAGAVLGFYRGGPVGLVTGLVLGHWLDRALVRWLRKASQSRPARLSAEQVARRKALLAAYQTLGVHPDDSDAVVKQAYRRAMSQHHPDRLRARGQPESLRAEATARVQQLQAAFALVKQERKSL